MKTNIKIHTILLVADIIVGAWRLSHNAGRGVRRCRKGSMVTERDRGRLCAPFRICTVWSRNLLQFVIIAVMRITFLSTMAVQTCQFLASRFESLGFPCHPDFSPLSHHVLVELPHNWSASSVITLSVQVVPDFGSPREHIEIPFPGRSHPPMNTCR